MHPRRSGLSLRARAVTARLPHCLPAWLLQLFFAAVGASADVWLVLRTAPVLFCWSAVALAAHLGLLLGVGRLAGISLKKLLLASNANIGGEGRRAPGEQQLRTTGTPGPAACSVCARRPVHGGRHGGRQGLAQPACPCHPHVHAGLCARELLGHGPGRSSAAADVRVRPTF